MALGTDEMIGASPKLLYVSCGENGLYGLKHLVRCGVRPECVVSLPPTLGLKYGVSGYADFSEFSGAANLHLRQLSNYDLTPDDVSDIEFDLVIVNGWNRLIHPDVFSRAKLGGLGVHAGHPPIGLGRAPLVWNILKGYSDIEVYVFRLTSNADDGDIMARQVVEITQQDNVALLYEKVMHVGACLFVDAIRLLSQGETGAAQDRYYIEYYPKRAPEHGLIDWSRDDLSIFNFIRAQSTPYPGAFSFLAGERWTILKAQPFDRFAFRATIREPGRIVAVLPSGPVVITGGAPVWILQAVIGDQSRPTDLWADMTDLCGKRFTNDRTSEC